ncbi:MAG: hypothetical protein IH614_00545, partial [Desulfuromonadales bacterium]|nr:hypothetical protein [Desulfuromonadales bacterium]
LERDFHAAHPDFTLQSRQEKLLPAAPARELIGQTAERALQVYLLTSSQRAFVLEFSAPPADFDRMRPLFEEMAESFTILKRGKP